MSIFTQLVEGRISLTSAVQQSVNWLRNKVSALPVVGPVAAGVVGELVTDAEAAAAVGLNAAADTVEGFRGAVDLAAKAYLTAQLGPVGEALAGGIVDGALTHAANTIEAALHGAAAAMAAKAAAPAGKAATAVPITPG